MKLVLMILSMLMLTSCYTMYNAKALKCHKNVNPYERGRSCETIGVFKELDQCLVLLNAYAELRARHPRIWKKVYKEKMHVCHYLNHDGDFYIRLGKEYDHELNGWMGKN